AEGDMRLVTRIPGASGDVNRFVGGERVAEYYRACFSMRGGATHFLRIVELADRDATQSQSDFADYFRGQTRHQNFDGCRHFPRGCTTPGQRSPCDGGDS